MACGVRIEVYMLWNKMATDDFYTDIIELARECSKTTEEALRGLDRDDFSEVYLFMDHDPQSRTQLGVGGDINCVMQEMLNTFDNETENGKLYISYPMIEAIRDLRRNDNCYRKCFVIIDDLGRYKEQSAEGSDFLDFRKLDYASWKTLCKHAVRKANCIVSSMYEVPSYLFFANALGQSQLFSHQLDKYIAYGKVAVISSIPLFLLEYHKEEFWNLIFGVAVV